MVTVRSAARRARSYMSGLLWILLLCGLLTDSDVDRLRNRYVSARTGRVRPHDPVSRAAELIPPPWMTLNHLEAFLADIARSHIPQPFSARDEAERALGTLATVRSVPEAARLVWNALWTDEEGITRQVCQQVETLMGPQPYDPLVDDIAETVSEQVRIALASQDFSGVIRQVDDRLGTAEARLLEKYDALSAAVAQLAASLDRMQSTLRQLAEREGRDNRRDDPHRIARAIRALVERQWTPSWIGALEERLDRWEKRIESVERSLLRGDWIRARRVAWLEAHPGAPLRIGLVADCANLYFGAASWRGRQVDMKALRERLGRGGQVVSAVAFAVQPRHADATSYLDALRRDGTWK